jgi:hypothetical protein
MFGAALGLLAGGLKILAVLDQVRPECPHGAIFLDRIAIRHEDGHRHAVAARRESQTLAVISCCGRDQSGGVWPLALQAIDIDESAPHLEGAGRRMVLMLDDSGRTEPLGQQRPLMRRGRRHGRGDDVLGTFQLSKVKHRLVSSKAVGSLSPLAPLSSYPPPGLATGEPDDRLQQRVSCKHRRTRSNRKRAGYWIVQSSRMMTVEFVAVGPQ